MLKSIAVLLKQYSTGTLSLTVKITARDAEW